MSLLNTNVFFLCFLVRFRVVPQNARLGNANCLKYQMIFIVRITTTKKPILKI